MLQALDKKQALELIARRHPEHSEHQLRWRWLLDSYEGGERYRQAVYGADRHGLPVRNLIRHKREYPDPREVQGLGGKYGSAVYIEGTATGLAGGNTGALIPIDPAKFAEDSDYELRRARTPVPTFLAEAVDGYMDKVFKGEVTREAPGGPAYDPLRAWWADVDGRETGVDDWVKDTIGPLLIALGCLDVAFDHPPAPAGQAVASRADVERLGLARCVAGHVLPDNVLWWVPTPDGTGYAECLVREYVPGGEEVAGTGIGPNAALLTANARYRHWTAEGSVLYDEEGGTVAVTPHPFGVVPVVRLFDRKKPRCQHVGTPRLESVAERQREYYNRDSELILSDTLQAHPLLQGPEDFVNADGTLPTGPNWLLPKKKNTHGGAATYEGFEVVDFPKGGAESIRDNKRDIRDDADRDAKLTKPAGTAGTSGTTVAQSGVSKGFDHDGLHARLSSVAKVLAKAEHRMARMALTVLTDGRPPADAKEEVGVSYPTVFSLYAADELATVTADFQAILAEAGGAPETETLLLCELVRKALPGRDDETYDRLDDELSLAVKAKAATRAREAEGTVRAKGEGEGEADDEADETGEFPEGE